MNFIPQEYRKWVVLGIIVVLVLSIYGYINGLYDQGVEMEPRLSAQYQMCQNDLSTYMNGFYEQYGVYANTLQGLDKFVEDAVKGRYDIVGADGKSTGRIDANLYINAIAEAYPDTQGITDLAAKLMDYVQAKRESFKNCQDQFLDMLQVADTWYGRGLVRKHIVKALGFPSDEFLIARIGEVKLTGPAALEKMHQIILSPDAKDAYITGESGPLSVPTLSE